MNLDEIAAIRNAALEELEDTRKMAKRRSNIGATLIGVLSACAGGTAAWLQARENDLVQQTEQRVKAEARAEAESQRLDNTSKELERFKDHAAQEHQAIRRDVSHVSDKVDEVLSRMPRQRSITTRRVRPAQEIQ